MNIQYICKGRIWNMCNNKGQPPQKRSEFSEARELSCEFQIGENFAFGRRVKWFGSNQKAMQINLNPAMESGASLLMGQGK
jgi:hypothetical protein